MNDTTIRIDSIEITNFKNIRYGRLDLENSKKGYKASILGLYGQNGSGKTALIDTLELLRLALSGKPIPSCFADYISTGCEFAVIKYGFQVCSKQDNSTYAVDYEVSIRRDTDDPEHNIEQPIAEEGHKVTLFHEILSYSSVCGGRKGGPSTMIDTGTEDNVVFAPAAKYKTYIGGDRETLINLLAAKQLARTSSRSFIFSRDLLNAIRQNSEESCDRFIMESLVFFGNYRLFVVSKSNIGVINTNVLPIIFNHAEGTAVYPEKVLMELNEPSLIPASAAEIAYKAIGSMNIVLSQLIPGLTITIKNIGNRLYRNGSIGYQVQLMSNRNDREIPMQYESEGSKKLISVLPFLIAICNEPGVTIAIDDLDAGIFEYLLGEILRILANHGKGHLIFTSHNLRPLETLDPCFTAFTTANPQNRYIRMTNVKADSNLRDLYYREIFLGEQSEPVYETTNNSEIALAFREAGHLDTNDTGTN